MADRTGLPNELAGKEVRVTERCVRVAVEGDRDRRVDFYTDRFLRPRERLSI